MAMYLEIVTIFIIVLLKVFNLVPYQRTKPCLVRYETGIPSGMSRRTDRLCISKVEFESSIFCQIAYDCNRIKYNQSEGKLLLANISFLSRY